MESYSDIILYLIYTMTVVFCRTMTSWFRIHLNNIQMKNWYQLLLQANYCWESFICGLECKISQSIKRGYINNCGFKLSKIVEPYWSFRRPIIAFSLTLQSTYHLVLKEKSISFKVSCAMRIIYKTAIEGLKCSWYKRSVNSDLFDL